MVRSVLLTGHTGFKGAWLSLWLHTLGARVTGLSLGVPTEPSLYEVARVEQGMHGSVMADIRDAGAVERALARARPEIVIHMAAQPLVRRSFAEPRLTYETNVMGTVNVLDAVRACESVRAVVVVTSDKCYENDGRDGPYRESDPLGGHDPYSSSKAAAELVTSAYRRSFLSEPDGPRVASARAGNVIGGGDWGRTGSSPTSCAPPSPARPCACATRAPFVPGSMCSTHSVAISCSPNRSANRLTTPVRGTSAPTIATRAPSSGSPRKSRGSGPAGFPGSAIAGSIRMRPTT